MLATTSFDMAGFATTANPGEAFGRNWEMARSAAQAALRTAAIQGPADVLAIRLDRPFVFFVRLGRGSPICFGGWAGDPSTDCGNTGES